MRRRFAQLVLSLLCMLPVWMVVPAPTQAQSEQTSAQPDNAAPSDSASDDVLTLFPHSQTSRYWISGQAKKDHFSKPSMNDWLAGAHRNLPKG